MASLLALAGFMGSGKSAVGSALALELGWRFIDLDNEVTSALGMSIGDFFDREGEACFRARESEVLQSVLRGAAEERVVLALGGGTLQKSESLESVLRAGTLVLLNVSAQEAWSRVLGSQRPLAKDQRAFFELWAQRRAIYEGAADWIIPTGDRQVQEVVAELAKLVALNGCALQTSWGRRLTGMSRSSLIVGGRDAFTFLGARATEVRGSGAVLHVVTDTNVVGAWGEQVLTALGCLGGDDVCVLEAGEESKSVAALERCWEWLAARKARREDVLVALGGGVVGDVAGFVGASYLRGMGMWQVPTSLLAQVDSSVGGKTAINLSSAKNLVGAFYPADMVVIDPATLVTLPEREYAGALGEVVKHALLDSEDALVYLEREVANIRARDEAVMSDLVKRNVWFKASVVEEDERETGLRAVLNLGHTTAHALESTLGYGHLNHGQAVALGLIVALSVSETVLGLDRSVRKRTTELLSGLGLKTTVDLPSVSSILAAAGRDKKVKSQTSGFVGLRAIGEPEWDLDVPPDTLGKALEDIRR